MNGSSSSYKLVRRNNQRENSQEEEHQYYVEFNKKNSRKVMGIDGVEKSKTSESF